MKKMLKKFFILMDKLNRKVNHIEPIPNTMDNVILLHKQKYKGKKIILEDGTIIQKGDMVIEIHVNNFTIHEVGNNIREIIRVFDRELKALAESMSKNGELSEIKGLFGRTVLYPITSRRGFEEKEIKSNLMINFLRVWDNLIKYAYENDSPNNKIKFREPKEIWISHNKLKKQFSIED